MLLQNDIDYIDMEKVNDSFKYQYIVVGVETKYKIVGQVKIIIQFSCCETKIFQLVDVILCYNRDNGHHEKFDFDVIHPWSDHFSRSVRKA